MIDRLRYFKYAKDLNEKHHKLLIEKELHFKGNINSFSLISVSQMSPELGIKSGLKSINSAEKLIKKELKLEKPGRSTEEKNLQSFIINYSMNHLGKLPFGNFTFVTSELAFKLKDKSRIVNDILAIDSQNNLAIIELKSLRDNKVKQQTIDFEEKVVNHNPSFINELVSTMIDKTWNGKVRKIAVWPAPLNESTKSVNKASGVELYNYTFKGVKTKKHVVMHDVTFHQE